MTAPATTPPTTSVPPRVGTSADPQAYLHGANLPWLDWGCDFGCGATRGASSAASREQIGAAFAAARDAGMNVVRWWVFPGDPYQILVDDQQLPVGIDPAVYADFDAALDLADQYGLSLIFTLFSGPGDLPSPWITTELGRQRLATALGELFAHYAGRATVHTWQVMNEPEWAIWNGTALPSDLRDLVTRIARSVHEHSSALVSVGGARLDGVGYWADLELDYITVHWYDEMQRLSECAACVTYTDVHAVYGVDTPVVIGEFYLGPDVDGVSRLEDWRSRGYAGALAWSLLPQQTEDRLEIDMAAATAFSGDDG
jgi:hypothetical protein